MSLAGSADIGWEWFRMIADLGEKFPEKRCWNRVQGGEEDGGGRRAQGNNVRDRGPWGGKTDMEGRVKG